MAENDTKKAKAPSEGSKNASKVKELTAKLAAEHNDYLRLMAEFETYRRRSAEERLSLVATASADTIKGLLPVLDDCERALQVLESSSAKGLEVIDAKGKPFDIDFHEAVAQIPSPSPEQKGTVLEVVQTGYLLSGKVIRYAKVVVGA